MTDDQAADAYTLPGLPCRIVITAGMLRALSCPERQVLLVAVSGLSALEAARDLHALLESARAAATS